MIPTLPQAIARLTSTVKDGNDDEGEYVRQSLRKDLALLLEELAKYHAAEAEEERIQKELDEAHDKIMAKTKEEVIADLVASGYSREELEEMAASTRQAIEWYMSMPAEKRGWLFAFKAGRASVLESKGETP